MRIAVEDNLHSPDPVKRLREIYRLGAMNDPAALTLLRRCLRDPDYRLQAASAESLGVLGDHQAVPELLSCFRGDTYRLIEGEGNPNSYAEIVTAAAKALGRLGGDVAAKALISGAASPDPLLVSASVAGLAFISGEEAFAVLLGALGHRMHFVRGAAARALGERGDLRASSSLLSLLEDPASIVRAAAIEALASLGEQKASGRISSLYRDLRRDICEGASPYHREDSILREDLHLMVSAAKGIALLESDIALIENDLFTGCWPVNIIAAIGLAHHDDHRVFESLMEAVRDSMNPSLQLEAARALVVLGDPSAVPVLKAVIAARDIWISEAQGILARFPDPIPRVAGWIADQVYPLLCGLVSGEGDFFQVCHRLAYLYRCGFTCIPVDFVYIDLELDDFPPPESWDQWDQLALAAAFVRLEPLLSASREKARRIASETLQKDFADRPCPQGPLLSRKGEVEDA